MIANYTLRQVLKRPHALVTNPSHNCITSSHRRAESSSDGLRPSRTPSHTHSKSWSKRNSQFLRNTGHNLPGCIILSDITYGGKDLEYLVDTFSLFKVPTNPNVCL